MFIQCSFDATKNKLDFHIRKDCVKRFREDLKEHATEIINYEKKDMKPLTDEKNKSYLNQDVCYIRKEGFGTDDNNRKYHKVRGHCHYTAHNICNLRYKTPKGIPLIFHNGSTYDYYFIINELTKKFEGKFQSLGENTEKYITFSVAIEEELDNNKTITHKLKFIDSIRFMSTSLSKLVNDLSEIYSKKFRTENSKYECEFKGLKNNKRFYNCKEC